MKADLQQCPGMTPSYSALLRLTLDTMNATAASTRHQKCRFYNCMAQNAANSPTEDSEYPPAELVHAAVAGPAAGSGAVPPMHVPQTGQPAAGKTV